MRPSQFLGLVALALLLYGVALNSELVVPAWSVPESAAAYLGLVFGLRLAAGVAACLCGLDTARAVLAGFAADLGRAAIPRRPAVLALDAGMAVVALLTHL